MASATVEIGLGTSLADALNKAIQPKLVEVGWGTGGPDDAALSEYIVLMLVNGKSESQIAEELSGELLNLGPDDPGARDFARWLFGQIEELNAMSADVPGPQDNAQGNNQDSANYNMTEGFDNDNDTDMTSASHVSNAPTGPRSMRNGQPTRGGAREKRIIGHISKAMDRSGDSILHRVRQTGNERIGRPGGPPTGPRMNQQGKQTRNGMNMTPMNIQRGLAAMSNVNMVPGPNGPGGPGGPPMPGGMMPGMNMPGMNDWAMANNQAPNPMDIYAMFEQQTRMMQQMMSGMAQNNGFNQTQSHRSGRPLHERVNQNPRRNNHHNQQRNGPQRTGESGESSTQGGAEGEDTEMDTSAPREAPNPDETVCKFNQNCTNKDCKFAHASPAAAPGVTIDVSDNCSFGAACKNHKCVGKHPSPAVKFAHQFAQDCKFFPNCHNPRCPFKHPSMPACRNGGECATPNCKFTHVKTKCRFNPCLNQQCPFVHDEGQRGSYKDKVWTAESGADEHVSERKFVNDNDAEEVVLPGGDSEQHPDGAEDDEEQRVYI